MTDAREAGDVTFVRPQPTPLSLDYTCSVCGQRLTPKDYLAKIGPDFKLYLTARHCGHHAEFVVWLGFGGSLFEAAPKQWKRPLDDLP